MFDAIGDVLWTLLRSILFFLDNAVYSLISMVYELLLYLANVSLTNQYVQNIISRIYVLLGIFMLFKVSLSILQYLVDPNAFTDKSKGFGKLVTNVLVSLVLLVMTPTIFTQLYNFQNIILSENIIGKIIMGVDTGSSSTDQDTITNEAVSAARDVQFLMYSAFFTLNTGDTNNNGVIDRGEEAGPLSECAGTPVLGSRAMARTGEQGDGGCLYALSDAMDAESSIMTAGVDLSDFFRTTSAGTDNRNFSSFGTLINWKIDNQFVINYVPLVSTLAGGIVVFLLLGFCIDIAVRVIKLCFLEMVAPISIISYIDPKETLGQGKLNAWIKETAKTFLSLFIRLAIIFFVVQLVQIISSVVFGGLSSDAGTITEGYEPQGAYPMFIFVFLVIGAFTFAKQAPKLIEELFGIKNSGEMTLNPFKNPLMAGIAGTSIGLGAGMYAGIRAGADAGAPVRGAISGALTGMSQARNSKLEPGLFGKVRRGTYKNLTGNELSTFNPWQRMMGKGGQRKVDEVGDPLNEAREQMNQAQTRLGILSHTSAESGGFLRSHGVQLDDIPDERTRHQQIRDRLQSQLQDAQRQRNSSITSRDSGQKRIDEINSQMEKNSQSMKIMADGREKFAIEDQNRALEKEKKKLEADIANHQSAINDADSLITGYQQQLTAEQEILTHLDRYASVVDEENTLRHQISDIQKDIDTLSDEKKQRKQFYGIDSSTKQDVSDALGHIADRRNGSS